MHAEHANEADVIVEIWGDCPSINPTVPLSGFINSSFLFSQDIAFVGRCQILQYKFSQK